jgi:hypothetical protein
LIITYYDKMQNSWEVNQVFSKIVCFVNKVKIFFNQTQQRMPQSQRCFLIFHILTENLSIRKNIFRKIKFLKTCEKFFRKGYFLKKIKHEKKIYVKLFQMKQNVRAIKSLTIFCRWGCDCLINRKKIFYLFFFCIF